LNFAPAQYVLRAFAPLEIKQFRQTGSTESKAIAEAAKYVVIGSAVGQSKKRVYVHREVWCHLINQTGVQCTDPWPRTDRVVEFNIPTQIPNYRTGESDRILPLNLHLAAASFIENVDPRLGKQRETRR